jgi:hypothetical protein
MMDRSGAAAFSLAFVPNSTVIELARTPFVTGMNRLLQLGVLVYTLSPVHCVNLRAEKAWVAVYAGSVGDCPPVFSYATAIAADASGNSYVTGIAYDCDHRYTISTVKYTPDGTGVWTNQFTRPDSQPRAIAVNSPGDVYVAAISPGTNGWDFLTIKLDGSSGRPIWEMRHNSPHGFPFVFGMALDSTENICIAGRIPSLRDDDFITIKYNSAGRELWAVRYDGALHGHDSAKAIAIDREDNVYVTGESDGEVFDPIYIPVEYSSFSTIKYSPDGVQVWAARYEPASAAADIAVDGEGNVFVFAQTESQCVTVKYNSAGMLQWDRRFGSDAGYGEIDAARISIFGDSNIVVTGTVEVRGDDSPTDIITVAYNTEGAELWLARLHAAGAANHVVDMKIDAADHIYITGFTHPSYEDGDDVADFVTFAYGPHGQRLWLERFDYNGADEPFALTLDRDGNVFVAGGGCNGFATIKYTALPSGPLPKLSV